MTEQRKEKIAKDKDLETLYAHFTSHVAGWHRDHLSVSQLYDRS